VEGGGEEGEVGTYVRTRRWLCFWFCKDFAGGGGAAYSKRMKMRKKKKKIIRQAMRIYII